MMWPKECGFYNPSSEAQEWEKNSTSNRQGKFFFFSSYICMILHSEHNWDKIGIFCFNKSLKRNFRKGYKDSLVICYSGERCDPWALYIYNIWVMNKYTYHNYCLYQQFLFYYYFEVFFVLHFAVWFSMHNSMHTCTFDQYVHWLILNENTKVLANAFSGIYCHCVWSTIHCRTMILE